MIMIPSQSVNVGLKSKRKMLMTEVSTIANEAANVFTITLAYLNNVRMYLNHLLTS